jgi:hypothetical protein
VRRDVVIDALEAVDVAPWCLPFAEVGGEFRGCGRQTIQQFFRSCGFDSATDLFAPEHGEGSGNRIGCPSLIPLAQDGDLLGQVGSWLRVISFDQARERFVKPRQITVEGGREK